MRPVVHQSGNVSVRAVQRNGGNRVHNMRLQKAVTDMNRIADEASANAVEAENVLADIEDREARRAARERVRA